MKCLKINIVLRDMNEQVRFPTFSHDLLNSGVIFPYLCLHIEVVLYLHRSVYITARCWYEDILPSKVTYRLLNIPPSPKPRTGPNILMPDMIPSIDKNILLVVQLKKKVCIKYSCCVLEKHILE